MRFLHTSDWHLGRSLHRADLREAQSGFLDHLRTRPAALADPVLLSDAHGVIAVYGVPYLEPGAADSGAPAGPRSHEAVLGAAARRIRADAAARGNPRTVVLAHAWVAGGASAQQRQQDAELHQSASERDISVGGIGYVPARLFTGFGYVALGHLHGRRTLTERMRYSGSPLPYSFSERGQPKGSWLVETGPGGQIRAEWVPAPVCKRLSVLAGRLDDLLTAREYDAQHGDFLAVTLTDTARPEGAMDRLRARFPHILTLEFRPEGVTADPRSYGQKVKGRDDLTVAAEFIRHVRSTGATAGERALLESAFTAARDLDPARAGES